MDDSKFDLCLTLFDNYDKITLNTIRQVLCEKCPYFQKLLSGNFTESNQNNVKIFVPNVFMVEEIIKSFFQTEDEIMPDLSWEYYFEKCFCLDFLMLSTSKYLNKIINLTIPENQYNILVRIFDIILSDLFNSGDKSKIALFNYSIIKYLINNLPVNFDKNLFPMNIRQNIDNSLYNNFLMVKDDNIYIENYTTNYNIIITKFVEGKYFFVPNKDKLIVVNDTITFIDIPSEKIIFTQTDPLDCMINKKYVINISPNHKYLVYGSDKNTIKILNIEENKIEENWCMNVDIINNDNDNEDDDDNDDDDNDIFGFTKILFTPDNKHIIVEGYAGQCQNVVQKYDLAGNLIWSTSSFGDSWNYFDIICQENKIIFSGIGPYYTWLEIGDIDTGKILFVENKYHETDYVCDIRDNYIALNDADKIYIYDLEKREEVKFLGEHENIRNLFYNKINNHLISQCDKYIKVWDLEFGFLDQIPIDKKIILPLFNYQKN
ncbi:hypothetical protein QJ854_gp087 [Moumouvirus goulette]|uniref:BTB domain-containing protein n=1 Tax=Moumouvirus goulette TaxID=1247379 RepID=M1NNQ4_9VIRU|nr:hypothetical protein QJ854_gp087 [Moumouvirus goulette]AGF85695.1 hypothetical protein glt_00892 [Moumouvirus goulette]